MKTKTRKTKTRKTTTAAGPDFCPECKLILNSLGLRGSLDGILALRRDLNARGRDFSPSILAKLCKVICGAHAELQALEAGLVMRSNTVPL